MTPLVSTWLRDLTNEIVDRHVLHFAAKIVKLSSPDRVTKAPLQVGQLHWTCHQGAGKPDWPAGNSLI